MKELENLPPFYLGEIVEYVTGANMPKGTKVKVTDIWLKPCGCWSICFNGNPREMRKLDPKSSGFKCSHCNKATTNDKTTYVGWKAASFRSIQKQNFPLMKFTEILKKEESQILIDN